MAKFYAVLGRRPYRLQLKQDFHEEEEHRQTLDAVKV